MTTTSTVIHEGLAASLTTNGGVSGGSVTIPYRVHDSDLQAMPLEVYTRATTAAPDPVPKRWDAYSVRTDSDNSIYCRSISIRRDAPPVSDIWIMEATFSELEPGKTFAHVNITNPLLRPPESWIEFETETQPVDEAILLGIRDAKGTITSTQISDPSGATVKTAGDIMPVVNAALGPVEDGLHENVTNLILVRKDNFASLQAITTQHLTYYKSLNSEGSEASVLKDTFGDVSGGTTNILLGTLSIPPMHMRYAGMQAGQLQNENGVDYYSALTRIEIANKPFSRDVVNQGFTYLTLDATLQPVRTSAETAEPVNLLDNGGLLGEGLTGNYVSYRTLRLVPYAPLLAGIA
jgi:hypothetical protein